jgi:hypothetical protein
MRDPKVNWFFSNFLIFVMPILIINYFRVLKKRNSPEQLINFVQVVLRVRKLVNQSTEPNFTILFNLKI